MAATGGRYPKVIKLIREAEDLARSGALVLDDGVAAIYFLWGQPSHAYLVGEGGERLEGEAALKEIALALAHPGKAAWKSRDVLPTETLRVTAEDLIGILEAMAAASRTTATPAAPAAAVFAATPPPVPASGAPAGTGEGEPAAAEPHDAAPPADHAPGDAAAGAHEPWSGQERRKGPALRYSLTDFPLLPSGPTLWADVPTSVIHLDVLIGTLRDVMVVFEAPSVRAAGVVCDGERYDAIYIDEDGVKTGRVAWELMIQQREGAVSAYEIDPEITRTLPVLWRNRIVHRDLDTTWINRADFLRAQAGEDEDRAVIVATPDAIGIALFAQGQSVGSYTTDMRAPHNGLGLIEQLLAEDVEGRVTVLERIADDVGESYVGEPPDEAPLEEEEDVAAVAEAFTFQPIDQSFPSVQAPEPPPGDVAPASPADTIDDVPADQPAAPADAVEPDTEAGAGDVLAAEHDAPGDHATPGDHDTAPGTDDDAEPASAEPGATVEPADEDVLKAAEAEGEPGAATEFDEEAVAAISWDPDDWRAGVGTEHDGDDADSQAFIPDIAADAAATDDAAADDAGATDGADGTPAAETEPEYDPAPFMPRQSLSFMPPGEGVGIQDFASMLGNPAAPEEPQPQRDPGYVPRDADAGRIASLLAEQSGTAAPEPSEPPPPPDFGAIVAELVSIGTRFLGPDFAPIEPLLTDAPPTAAGLRGAISTIRRSEVPGHDPDVVRSMARAMVLYVADRVSAT